MLLLSVHLVDMHKNNFLCDHMYGNAGKRGDGNEYSPGRR